jgi:hypothetical protein
MNMAINLQEYLPEKVCVMVERALGLRLDRMTVCYGWGGKSAGFRTDQATWLRVSYRSSDQINERTWTGEECASALLSVAKPRLLRSFRWLDEEQNLVWRADELALVSSPLVSATPQIDANPELADEWWAQLTSSLSALGLHKTTRVGVRQDLVNRRIAEFAGDCIDPTIEEWATAHADLHWANVTAPDLHILDWEGWGVGPRGLDAATLWAYSLLAPPVAERIQAEFKKDLATRSGKLAQLFTCVELLHMIWKFGDHPRLEEPLVGAANSLVSELTATV